jgi:hypothetical protein
MEGDTEIMQEAYDSILKGWPLRHPEGEKEKEAWEEAWALQREAKAVLESVYLPPEGKQRPSTEAERAACRNSGCSSESWNAGCPLHGFPALLRKIDNAKSYLKGIMAEAALKHAAVECHDGSPGFWESQAVRAELALLSLTAPAPILLLEALRSQLRAKVTA